MLVSPSHNPLTKGAAGLALLFLTFWLLYPLAGLLALSFSEPGGTAGLANYAQYFATPGLKAAFRNTLLLGLSVTIVSVGAAFVLAWGLTHANIYGKGAFRQVALLPMFVPSIFPAIGLIYLFGGQGLFRGLLLGHDLYGPIGVFLASVIYTLPQATLLLLGALGEIDQNLYDAARTMSAGPWRRFLTVTVPGSLYGLASAGIVVFILTITDFGIPKVLGGNLNLLSLEIYKQIIGLADFRMGATAAMVLTWPTVLALLLDHWARTRQERARRGADARAITLSGPKSALATLAVAAVLALPMGTVAMVALGSLISFWPYDFSLTWGNYLFTDTIYGWSPYFNSLALAATVALGGTALIFGAAYLMERCRVQRCLSRPYHFLAVLPLSIPGTVLGPAFVLAFGGWQWVAGHNFAFMAVNTIIHLYPVAHLTCVGALNRLPADFEAAGQCLGVGRATTFRRVVLPLEAATLGNVAFYLFINALTTISALVFIYAPDNIPASVAILNMLDAGQTSEAAAMSMLILGTALLLRILPYGRALHRICPNTTQAEG